MKKSIVFLASACTAVLAVAPFAHADAELEILVNNVVEGFATGVGTSGNISINSISAGGWTVNYADGIWSPSGTIPTLDMGSFEISQSGAGVLTLLFSVNNNVRPGGTSVLTASGILNGGLTGTLSGFWDPGNTFLATTDPLGSVSLNGGTSYSSVSASGPFSLTEVFQITAGTGSISADDQLTVALNVPDGGTTMEMLGAGLAGLSLVRRWFATKA